MVVLSSAITNKLACVQNNRNIARVMLKTTLCGRLQLSMDLKNIANYVNTQITRGRKNITEYKGLSNYFDSQNFRERLNVRIETLKGFSSYLNSQDFKDRLNIQITTLRGLPTYLNSPDFKERVKIQTIAKNVQTYFQSGKFNDDINMRIGQMKALSAYLNDQIVKGRANTNKMIIELRAYSNYLKSDDFKERLKLVDTKLQEVGKQFSGNTMKGRANVAKATYTTVGTLILLFSLRPSKK